MEANVHVSSIQFSAKLQLLSKLALVPLARKQALDKPHKIRDPEQRSKLNQIAGRFETFIRVSEHSETRLPPRFCPNLLQWDAVASQDPIVASSSARIIDPNSAFYTYWWVLTRLPKPSHSLPFPTCAPFPHLQDVRSPGGEHLQRDHCAVPLWIRFLPHLAASHAARLHW